MDKKVIIILELYHCYSLCLGVKGNSGDPGSAGIPGDPGIRGPRGFIGKTIIIQVSYILHT